MRKKIMPVHPGEILYKDLMKPLGLSQNKLAEELGVDAGRINAIIQGKRSITADTALRLARYFKTTPEFWMNLQTRYDLIVTGLAKGQYIKKDVKPLADQDTTGNIASHAADTLHDTNKSRHRRPS